MSAEKDLSTQTIDTQLPRPTAAQFWGTALRPKWVGMLLLALVVATVFVGLSYWQLERANETAAPPSHDTESRVELSAVQEPQRPTTDEAAGRLVELRGEWVQQEQPLLLQGRVNSESGDETGTWVIARFHAELPSAERAELAVAIGWFSDTSGEQKLPSYELPEGMQELRGRFFPAEPAIQSGAFDGRYLASMSPAVMINVWEEPLEALRYSGYLILDDAPEGLVQIYSPAPDLTAEPNFLNLFYAFEWVVFAGFAFFIWYRMVKDEWIDEQLKTLEPRVE